MAPHRRNRERRPGRRLAFKDPKPTILLVCEGEVSEPEYFDGLSRSVHNPRVAIRIQPACGVPRTVVEAAKKLKNEASEDARREGDDNIAFDSVWCVIDVDDHPDITGAQQMARDNGIEVALSNPNFELWLLLHFRENPGMQHRDKIRELLKSHLPGYNKHIDYKLYEPGYSDAVRRARRLDQAASADGEHGRNPSTSVYRVTELIREN